MSSTVSIDILKDCLIKNGFFYTSPGQAVDTAAEAKLALKSAICLRFLLFFDSLHDFLDNERLLVALKQIKVNSNNQQAVVFKSIMGDTLTHTAFAKFNQLFDEANQAIATAAANKNNSNKVQLQKTNNQALLRSAAVGVEMWNLLKIESQTETMNDIQIDIFYKLLEDLYYILTEYFKVASPEPEGSNLSILSSIVYKMHNCIKLGKNMNNLTIYSIFENTNGGTVKTQMKNNAAAMPADFKKNFFYYKEGEDDDGEHIYLYPYALFKINRTSCTPEPPMGSTDKYFEDLKGEMPAFFDTHCKLRTGTGLRDPTNELMNFIKKNELSPGTDVDNFPIYIIICLLYFWNNSNIRVSSSEENPVHKFYFKYILEYSLNCFEHKPKVEHLNVETRELKTINYINLIIKYLCKQDPSLLTNSESSKNPCVDWLKHFYATQITQQPPAPLNLNTYFDKPIDLVIDADGKPRSINYLTSYFLQLFTSANLDSNYCTIYQTLGSVFDASTTSNVESLLNKIILQTVAQEPTEEAPVKVAREAKIQSYAPPLSFKISAGGIPLMDLEFTLPTANAPNIQFNQYFASIPPKPNPIQGGGDGSVSTAVFKYLISKLAGHPDINYLLVKTMGDFSQMLYYYALRLGRSNTTVGIYHTLDTWAAGLASLFVKGVICEQGMDEVKLDNNSIYKLANNKMYISKEVLDYLNDSDQTWNFQNDPNIKLFLQTATTNSPAVQYQLLSMVNLDNLKERLLENLNSDQGQIVKFAINSPEASTELIQMIKTLLDRVKTTGEEITKRKAEVADLEQQKIQLEPNLHPDAISLINASLQIANQALLLLQKFFDAIVPYEGLLESLLQETNSLQDIAISSEEVITNAEDATGMGGPPSPLPTGATQGGMTTRSGFTYIVQEIGQAVEDGELVENPQITKHKIDEASSNFTQYIENINQQNQLLLQQLMALDQQAQPTLSQLEELLLRAQSSSDTIVLAKFMENILSLMPQNLANKLQNEINVKEIIEENKGMQLRSGRRLATSREVAAVRRQDRGAKPMSHMKGPMKTIQKKPTKKKATMTGGVGGGKLTVKAKKKKLFKKTKKKTLKKGKLRKHYKTRKHYKSKNPKNMEKIFKNLKI